MEHQILHAHQTNSHSPSHTDSVLSDDGEQSARAQSELQRVPPVPGHVHTEHPDPDLSVLRFLQQSLQQIEIRQQSETISMGGGEDGSVWFWLGCMPTVAAFFSCLIGTEILGECNNKSILCSRALLGQAAKGAVAPSLLLGDRSIAPIQTHIPGLIYRFNALETGRWESFN